MDQEKIGKFIAECRKKKKLTQEELAERIGVNSRSVSRWETGKCAPDLSLYKIICEELEITINELMSGEKINKEEYQDKFEKNIINVVNDVEIKNKRSNLLTNIFFGIIVLFVIWFVTYAFYSNVYFKTNLQKEDILILKEKDNNLIFRTECTGKKEYLFLNYDNKGLIFISYKQTLEDKFNCSRQKNQKIDLTKGLLDGDYNGSKIFIDNSNIKDNYQVYYTKTSFSVIRKANEKEFKKIINKSILVFEN